MKKLSVLFAAVMMFMSFGVAKAQKDSYSKCGGYS